MAVFLAFLRGINVGSNNRIRMADLRNVFQDLGFTDVQTYIQSGNVIFRSAKAAGKILFMPDGNCICFCRMVFMLLN